MADTALASRLTDLLEPQTAEHDLELVAVEVAGAKDAPLVRVLLDRDGGISIDTIAEASGWIMEALDTVTELGEDYTLEASSPGINRPLRLPNHFERFIGENVKVQTRTLVDGRRHFNGAIVGVDSDTVRIDVEGTVYTVPFAEIDKARLNVEIDFNREALDGI